MSMRSRLHFWRRSLWDWLRYSPLTGRVMSHLLAGLARFRRQPLQQLETLTRAARVCPTLARLQQLRPAFAAALDQVTPATLKTTVARPDLSKSILLKPPVSPREKGVIYLTFEKQWLRLLQSGHAAAIAQEYDVVLGPSSSPPPHVELLLMAKLWPGRVFTLLSNLDDAAIMKAVSPRLEPIPLLASSWVDPDVFAPYLGQPKEYDLTMLAHFDPVKRHWLLFDALRRLPQSFRVLLLGVPLSGRTEKDLYAEARTFGMQDRFELQLRPARAEILSALARSKASLIFSRQEGSCIAVTESLFADTPVGLFRNARIGSKAFINERTGVLLDRARLSAQLRAFVEKAHTFAPREWAIRNIGCQVSLKVLNEALSKAARWDGRPWTTDLCAFRQDLLPAYLSAADETLLRPHQERFAREWGLLLGPSARATTGQPRELTTTRG